MPLSSIINEELDKEQGIESINKREESINKREEIEKVTESSDKDSVITIIICLLILIIL